MKKLPSHLQHVGKPFEVLFCFEKEWGKITNFISPEESNKKQGEIEDLDQCFLWAEEATRINGCEHCIILDFSKEIIYYNNPKGLGYILTEYLPSLDLDGYFTHLCKKIF